VILCRRILPGASTSHARARVGRIPTQPGPAGGVDATELVLAVMVTAASAETLSAGREELTRR